MLLPDLDSFRHSSAILDPVTLCRRYSYLPDAHHCGLFLALEKGKWKNLKIGEAFFLFMAMSWPVNLLGITEVVVHMKFLPYLWFLNLG